METCCSWSNASFVLILRVIKLKPPVSWKQMFSSDMTFSCYTLATGPKHRVGQINSVAVQVKRDQIIPQCTYATICKVIAAKYHWSASSSSCCAGFSFKRRIEPQNDFITEFISTQEMLSPCGFDLRQKLLSNRNSHVGPCWRKGTAISSSKSWIQSPPVCY